MSTWMGRATRTASGVGVLAAVALVVAGGVRLPDVGAGPVSQPARVDVAPSAVTLTCPSPLILPTAEGDKAFDPVPVQPVTSVAAVAASSGGTTVAPAAGGDVLAALAAGGAVAQVPGVSTSLAVTAAPTTGSEPEAARVAASFGSIVTAGDLRGLSAASCQRPTTDAWLVGGATDLSSTDQLVLSAAGATPAEVDVTVYGPSGKVDVTAEHYVVAPGASKVVVLGAVAAEQRRVAVRVRATGGAVTAYVQDSALDGFTPRGTDLVVPGAGPARKQVIPGLSLVAAGVDSPLAGAVRLLVTGSKAATAHIHLYGPAGEEDLGGAQDVALAPGEVTDVPLGGVPTGSYTAVVTSDRPVVASGLAARAGAATSVDPNPSTERAWVPSSPAGTSGIVAVPVGTRGTLVATAVGSSGTATGTLRAIGTDGRVLSERQVNVPAGTTGAWLTDALVGTGPIAAGTPGAATPGVRVAGVELVPDDGKVRLAWALVADVPRPDGDLFSVLSPVPAVADEAAVSVRHDPRLGTR